jgi:hypothetical protein
MAADRIEHLYGQALEAWRRSIGNHKPDPKYLSAAARIALAQARLGVPFGLMIAAQAELPDDETPTSEAPVQEPPPKPAACDSPTINESDAKLQPSETVPIAPHHPPGDCSEKTNSTAAPPLEHLAPPTATSAATKTSVPASAVNRAARRKFFAPVQQLLEEDQPKHKSRPSAHRDEPNSTRLAG